MSDIRHGLSNEAYHADASHISKSGLDAFARSPAIFYARYLDPNRPPRPAPTPAMALGSMTHCAVLEPAAFLDRYAIVPKCDRRTTAGKAEFAAFQATLKPGQELVESDMVTQAVRMGESVRKIGPVAELLAQGEAEVSAYYTEPTSGALCRVRPDWVAPMGDGVLILDLKTTIDARPAGFPRSVANWNYAMQAAMYTDGYEIASRKRVYGFVFAAVEKEHPYAAAAYMLPDEVIEQARRKYQRLLTRYVECLATNAWPGYTQDNEIQLLQMPKWAMQEEIQ